MAIIVRNKNTAYGLNADLAALQAADSAEAIARIAGDAKSTSDAAAAMDAEVLARTTAASIEHTARLLAESTEVTNRNLAITAEALLRTNAATAENAVRVQAEADEAQARIAGDQAQADALTAHVTGAFTTAKNLLDVVNGDASTSGSFRKAFADLIDGAPVALNTLKEIADYIAVHPDANVAAAITAHVDAAVAQMTGTATALMDTFGEVETALNAEIAARILAGSTEVTNRNSAILVETNARISAVSTEVSDRNAAILVETTARLDAAASENTARLAAEAALLASAKVYADNSATQGGSLPRVESLIVAANKIVLTNAPKGGIGGIMNFATVRYTDGNGIAYDAPVSVDSSDVTGKTFVVSVDASGEWNGFSVQVQYLYVNA
ncbi:MAG: hypothetical protein QX197_02055 [Methylococcaceae bacterium]